MRAFRTHPTSGLEVLCRLRLAPNGTLAFQTALIGALSVFGLLRMCRLLLNCFGALKAACTFSGSPKRDAHPASGLRSFEQKPRACVPHTPYIGIGGFMRATLAENFVRATACFQTASKNGLRPSEKQKPHACIPRTPNIRIEGLCGYGLF